MKERWHRNHHLYEALFWAALAVPTLLWWRDSVLWVALMSLYANFKVAISAHEGRQARLDIEESNGSAS